jgi:RND family efflux transporter MFP subunit
MTKLKQIIIAFFIIVSLLTSACHRGLQEAAEAKPVVEVHVAKATTQAIADLVTAMGAIHPLEKASVGAKISAPIHRMAILKGKRVAEGEVIAELESRDLEAAKNEAAAALREAEFSLEKLTGGVQQTEIARAEAALRGANANLTAAKIAHARNQRLLAEGAIPQRELEASAARLTVAESEQRVAEQALRAQEQAVAIRDLQIARSRVEQARAKLAAAEAQRSYAVVRSPVAGVVTEQLFYEGETAQAGAPLVTVMKLDPVIVRANVAEADAKRLRVGAQAQITSDTGEVSGKVKLINPAVDQTNRTIEVWVEAANPGGRLAPGGFVRVAITAQNIGQALVVPVSAVQFAADKSEGTVSVVDNKSVAHTVKVGVGVRAGDVVEITSGLQEGQLVITEGNYALADGTQVKAVNQP